MHITVTVRHTDITEALRRYIEGKLKKLEKFSINIIEIHVILTAERDRYLVEILLVAKRLSISSKAQTQDMYTSFDSALDLLESRITKYLDKRKTHRLRVLKKKPQAVKSRKRLIRADRNELKPMSIGEAREQLEVSGNDFLVFNNEEENKVNVIYKRKDGNLGLIDTK
jgi:putative sigma-54 modulation protein